MSNSEPAEQPAKTKEATSIFQSRWFADLNMIMVAVFWGVNMPLMKSALAKIDPFFFNATRLSLSAVVLGLIVWIQKIPVIDRRPDADPLYKQVFYWLLFSLMSGFIYQVLFVQGMNYTSAVNTSLIITSIPVWIAILAALLLNEQLSRVAWIGLLIAVTGTLLVTVSKAKSTSGDWPLLGNALICAAAFSWALSSVWSRPMMKKLSPIALAFLGVTIAVPAHWFVARDSVHQISLVFSDPVLLATIIYSGVCSTGLAYAMWNFGIRILGASHASAFQNLVPLIAIFSSWLLLAEYPIALQLVGGGLIIGGLIVMRRVRRI